MSDKLLCINVKGKNGKTYGFNFYGDPKYLDEWHAEGFDIDEVLNSIPAWWVDSGLPVRWWCFWQDVFYFKNPWSKE